MGSQDTISQMIKRPQVAITMGDPAGVGPETIVSCWNSSEVHERCRPIVVGRCEIIDRAIQLLRLPLQVESISSPDDAPDDRSIIGCITAGRDDAIDVPPAQIDPRGGQAAFDALAVAADLAMTGKVDAITTAPLNKAALHQAGYNHPGHTELLGEFCGVRDTAMLLYLGPGERISGGGGLGVVHTTLHTALRDVFEALDAETIVARISQVEHFMRAMLSGHGQPGTTPRIGVCALNPHAGEQGLFGDEEISIIGPAVRLAQEQGLSVTGPLPADTLFCQAAAGEFDAVVAMYHDQGHIALKLLDMHGAVNVTLGLPIIRTSVAHGTAFDLAWQGVADSRSMIEALRVASVLAHQSFITPPNATVAHN